MRALSGNGRRSFALVDLQQHSIQVVRTSCLAMAKLVRLNQPPQPSD